MIVLKNQISILKIKEKKQKIDEREKEMKRNKSNIK